MKRNIYIVIIVVVVIGIIFWALNQSSKKIDENVNDEEAATVSTLSITPATSPASLVLAGAMVIEWQTSKYPVGAAVNINLIRQTSDSPREFTLVRSLFQDTPNDGEELWVPESGETSDDLYVEVTCSTSYQFEQACTLSSEPIKVN